MKCKVFKIHPQNDFDETKLNKFLETVTLNQTFASIVNEETHFWSVLVFYEDKLTLSKKPLASEKSESVEQSHNIVELVSKSAKTTVPRKEIAIANFAPEPAELTAEQEKSYTALRSWRNERASHDGVPPYLIAHNDSLMQMATTAIKSHEDLLQIKGLGEKRVQKYGDEILRILNVAQE